MALLAPFLVSLSNCIAILNHSLQAKTFRLYLHHNPLSNKRQISFSFDSLKYKDNNSIEIAKSHVLQISLHITMVIWSLI